MEPKTFSIVTSISIVFAVTATVISLISITITGFYPRIIVLFLMALITVASKFYGKKISNHSQDFQKNYYTIVTIINVLLIVIVLWMSFVIVHDRALHDCC